MNHPNPIFHQKVGLFSKVGDLHIRQKEITSSDLSSSSSLSSSSTFGIMKPCMNALPISQGGNFLIQVKEF